MVQQHGRKINLYLKKEILIANFYPKKENWSKLHMFQPKKCKTKFRKESIPVMKNQGCLI